MNINEYRLAAIRKLIDMARQNKIEAVSDYCLKLAGEITIEDSFNDPLEWFGYLLECNLRSLVRERTGKLIESQVIAETDLLQGIQSLQYYVGDDILHLLHVENMEKVFTSNLEAYFSYCNEGKRYHFRFKISKIPSESSIKIKIIREKL